MLRIDASISPAGLSLERFRLPAWVGALVLSALAAILISFARSTPLYFSPALTRVEVAPAAGTERQWRRTLWWRTPYGHGPYWVRFTLDRRKLDFQAPALALAGSYSATVWVNGAYAGAKGVPGEDAASERIGPVDAAIPLSGKLTREKNDVLLKLSSFHAGYTPKYLINMLGLREYDGDARRRPQQYLIAATQIGLLAVFGIFFLYQLRLDVRARAPRWAAAASAAILVAFAAEASRVFINYPYSLQGTRLFTTWAMLTLFGTFLNLFVISRFKTVGYFLYPAVGLALVLELAWPASDFQNASSIVCLMTAAIAALLCVRGRERGTARKLAAWLAPWPLFGLLDSAQFLDNGIYVSASLTLLCIAGNLGPRDAAAMPSAIKPPDSLCIEGRDVPLSALRAAHAAGNYTEFEFRDGSRRLSRMKFSSLFDAPCALTRVHRSHAVNLDHVRRLRAEKGSRYQLELDNGSRLPVSRAAAAAVRAALTNRPPMPASTGPS